MDIENIGYKKDIGGNKMYYYKFILNFNIEYLIVDTIKLGLIDMMWSKDNKFINGNLSKSVLNWIESEIKFLPKKDVEIEIENGENIFFTQHKIIEIKKPEKIKRSGNIYSHKEINEILNVLNEFDFLYNENKIKIITQEISDYSNEHENYDDLFKELINYKFSFETDGSHKTDGQMVRYTFTFTSPKNEETIFSTEMCLMCGWNCSDSVIIK
jgi:hemerythrin